MHLPKTPLVIGLLAALPLAVLAQGWTPPPADETEPPVLRAPETEGRSAPDSSAEDAFDLIERGAGLLLNEMLRQAEPHLNDMSRNFGEAMDTLGPLVGDLAKQVDDMGNYDAPERLENGDIIIRRKADAPPPPPPGETLRRFTIPRSQPKPPDAAKPPVSPDQPQIEL